MFACPTRFKELLEDLPRICNVWRGSIRFPSDHFESEGSVEAARKWRENHFGCIRFKQSKKIRRTRRGLPIILFLQLMKRVCQPCDRIIWRKSRTIKHYSPEPGPKQLAQQLGKEAHCAKRSLSKPILQILRARKRAASGRCSCKRARRAGSAATFAASRIRSGRPRARGLRSRVAEPIARVEFAAK